MLADLRYRTKYRKDDTEVKTLKQGYNMQITMPKAKILVCNIQ